MARPEGERLERLEEFRLQVGEITVALLMGVEPERIAVQLQKALAKVVTDSDARAALGEQVDEGLRDGQQNDS